MNQLVDARAFAAGEQVGGGRYLLKKVLGHGGMGVVWLAFDKRLSELVALKFLPDDIACDASALESLRRETIRSRRLSHPNIIRIHDFHEAPDERPFISMEYVDGPDLHYARERRPTRVLPWKFVAPILRQLCLALDYLHSEGLVHRDLKPANLMLDSTERLKLADFGLACVTGQAKQRLTGQGTVPGTLLFMSPQQADGNLPAPADDIYALGATLYELLTSTPPFYNGDIGYQIRQNRPDRPAQRLLDLGIENEIPSDVAALLMACLAKEPDQRPVSAKAILQWLESAEAQRKIEPAFVPSPESEPPLPAKNSAPPVLAQSAAPHLTEQLSARSDSATRPRLAAIIAAALIAMVLAGGAILGWKLFGKAVKREGASRATNSSQAALLPEGYELLFNGRNLAGWDGDPKAWNVEDGAITGRYDVSYRGRRRSTGLFYAGAPLGDFELRFRFRTLGEGPGDVFYRAKHEANYFPTGYAYALWPGSMGVLHDLQLRRTRRFASNPTDQMISVRPGEWHEAVIVARGNRFQHTLDGVVVRDVVDEEDKFRAGALALSIHPKSMGIQFKDIRLRRLPSGPTAAVP